MTATQKKQIKKIYLARKAANVQFFLSLLETTPAEQINKDILNLIIDDERNNDLIISKINAGAYND